MEWTSTYSTSGTIGQLRADGLSCAYPWLTSNYVDRFNNGYLLSLCPYPVARAGYDLTMRELNLMLNGGLAYGPYNVNRIPLTSDPMPAALLSNPMIQLTPIFDIGAVFRIRSIHRRGPKPPSVSRYTAVTVMLLVVYNHVPSMQ